METRRDLRLARQRQTRRARFVDALGGAPFDPTAGVAGAALLPERYKRIATEPRPVDAVRRPGQRLWAGRPPLTARHGRRLLWSVLFVLYAYLALFALVVLFSTFGN